MKKLTPFDVENLRDRFAREKRFSDFKKTYSSSYSQLKNLNTGKFWNKIFQNNPTFRDQDAMTKEKIDKVISFLPPAGSKILDLGIGQGYLEERLKEKKLNYKIYGIDISSICIKRAKKMFKGEFRLGDVLQIDKYYKPDLFDAVVALELIEHIPPIKIFSFYSKVKKILKENGTFIITTPLNEGLKSMSENPSGHVREYTMPILKTEFDISRFEILNLKTFYAFRNFYFMKKIISLIFSNKWKPNNTVIKLVKKS